MGEIISMQSFTRSELDNSRFCSFDFEVIAEPSAPLIHKDARFLFVKKGAGVLRLQGKSYPLLKGSLVAILPWQVSEIIRVDATLQYNLIAYHFDTVERAARTFRAETDAPLPILALIEQSPVVQLSVAGEREVCAISDALVEELGLESMRQRQHARSFSSMRIVSYLIQLLVLYCRNAAEFPADEKGTLFDGTQILRYMYLHCNGKLTLKTLADIFFVSRSRVSAWISRLTGLSFFDLLNEMRVGKTINYLLYTDLTIKEIAEFLGYVDESHISKVFAARMGTRISEYRNTYRRVENICQIEESRTAYRVINHIYRNYENDLNAKTIAKEFGLNVEQLNHLLLCQTERSFNAFLNLVRINRACEMLLETDKSVIDIAYEVGYRTPKTFSRNFLLLQKMTPSEYRSEKREK